MTGLQYLFVVLLTLIGLVMYGGFHPLAVDLVNLFAERPSVELVEQTKVHLYLLAGVTGSPAAGLCGRVWGYRACDAT